MSNSKKDLLEWLVAILIGILIVMMIRTFIATNYEIIGKSMLPTLHDQDRVLVTKLSNVERMDIIIFQSDKKEEYVKRVIGVPGDTIKTENDVLYINDKKVEEAYLESYPAYQHPEEDFTENLELLELTGNKTVPPNKFFVLGDNRMSSLDSRYFHFIDKKDVIGKVEARYWPISSATLHLNSE